MSRRKRQPEQFDVVDFLRESDGDLKSALNSLLRSPAATPEEEDQANSRPGLKLVAGPTLAPQEHNGNILGSELAAPVSLGPGPELMAQSNEPNPGVNLIPGPDIVTNSPPSAKGSGSGLKLRPGVHFPSSSQTPDHTATFFTSPEPSIEPRKRQFPIREMKLAQDAHTRAEQQVYEYLWQNAKVLDEMSRTITIGFGAMARMVRLSESNARINVRSLIAKLAIEEFGDYNCERSLGRTYRIFNYSEILKRRREAGLLWYMRRTLAVVFVNPSTGQPVDSALRKPRPLKPAPGPNLSGDGGVNLTPEPLPKLGR
jgi:hypothetical protein